MCVIVIPEGETQEKRKKKRNSSGQEYFKINDRHQTT
jgi:hypothetical protein